MNTLIKSICTATLFCAMTACGNTENGRSTTIDSTVHNGLAPVQYTEGTPANKIDSSIQPRDAVRKDTGGNQQTLPQNQPQGMGTNSSNTTDSRTTSGSANRGDADKDLKK